MAYSVAFFAAVPEIPPMKGVFEPIRDLRVLRIPANFDKDGQHFWISVNSLVLDVYFIVFLGHCRPNTSAAKGDIDVCFVNAGYNYFWDGVLPEAPLDFEERTWFSVAPIDCLFPLDVPFLKSFKPKLIIFQFFIQYIIRVALGIHRWS